jgi:hypothetical protein
VFALPGGWSSCSSLRSAAGTCSISSLFHRRLFAEELLHVAEVAQACLIASSYRWLHCEQSCIADVHVTRHMVMRSGGGNVRIHEVLALRMIDLKNCTAVCEGTVSSRECCVIAVSACCMVMKWMSSRWTNSACTRPLLFTQTSTSCSLQVAVSQSKQPQNSRNFACTRWSCALSPRQHSLSPGREGFL